LWTADSEEGTTYLFRLAYGREKRERGKKNKGKRKGRRDLKEPDFFLGHGVNQAEW
jgi:hypothetical protein